MHTFLVATLLRGNACINVGLISDSASGVSFVLFVLDALRLSNLQECTRIHTAVDEIPGLRRVVVLI